MIWDGPVFLSESDELKVLEAIQKAEKLTSAEIRVHLEPFCKIPVLDRAADVFGFLHMHETKERNGILFYVAYEDHFLAILGDIGVNSKVGSQFWEEPKNLMVSYFKEMKHAEGLVKAIQLVAEKMAPLFPLREDNPNELDNDISYG